MGLQLGDQLFDCALDSDDEDFVAPALERIGDLLHDDVRYGVARFEIRKHTDAHGPSAQRRRELGSATLSCTSPRQPSPETPFSSMYFLKLSTLLCTLALKIPRASARFSTAPCGS